LTASIEERHAFPHTWLVLHT